MSDDDSDQTQGVDFASIDSVFEELSYPVTADELVERYGDREIERTNADPITIEELFDYMGDDTFESEDQLRQMIMAQMPRDSEGRTDYSDRGGASPEATEEAEDAGEGDYEDVQEGTSTDPETKQQPE